MATSWMLHISLFLVSIGAATASPAAPLPTSDRNVALNSTRCRDAPVCSRLPASHLCEDNSQDLVKRLCPAHCGFCSCQDSGDFDCSALLPGVCSSAAIANVCPRTCHDCVDQTFPADLQCPNKSCADCSYPLGRAACPDFCNKCDTLSTTAAAAPMTASSVVTVTPKPTNDVTSQPNVNPTKTQQNVNQTSTPDADWCDWQDFNGCDKAEVVFMIAHTKYDTFVGVDHEGVYVKEIINEFVVDEDHVRVGVVSYNNTVQESIHITEYKNDKAGLLNRVEQLTKNRQQATEHELARGGEPNVAGALDWVRKHAFKDARPGAKRVLIPIIHKLSYLDWNLAIAAAAGVKASCVQIYAQSVDHSIALGDIVGLIASRVYPPWYNYYANFSDLENGAKNFHLGCPGQT